MAKILTAKEMVDSLDQMAREVCKEEGIDYDEFIMALADAMGMQD